MSIVFGFPESVKYSTCRRVGEYWCQTLISCWTSCSSAFYWHSKQISGPPLCPRFLGSRRGGHSPRSVIYQSIRSTKQCSKISQPTSRRHIKISPLCVFLVHIRQYPLQRGALPSVALLSTGGESRALYNRREY